MASKEHILPTSISDVYMTQTCNTPTSLQVEQLIPSEKCSYGETSSLPADETSPPDYVTVNKVSQDNMSYSMITEQYHTADTVRLATIPRCAMETDDEPEPGYDMTTYHVEELNTFGEMMLNDDNDRSIWTEDYSDTEHDYHYRGLLACNGDFILPLELMTVVAKGTDTWSIVATIGDEDQDYIQGVSKEGSWT